MDSVPVTDTVKGGEQNQWFKVLTSLYLDSNCMIVVLINFMKCSKGDVLPYPVISLCWSMFMGHIWSETISVLIEIPEKVLVLILSYLILSFHQKAYWCCQLE